MRVAAEVVPIEARNEVRDGEGVATTDPGGVGFARGGGGGVPIFR